MEIRIQKLDEQAIIPKRQTQWSAGADLHAWLYDMPYEQIWLNPGETVKIGTKLAVEIPIGYFGGIFARSGLATKMGLAPINCVGIIDSDYRGEIIVALHNHSKQKQYIQNNERIAQLIIIPYINFELMVVDTLISTNRGNQGFGSTGQQ